MRKLTPVQNNIKEVVEIANDYGLNAPDYMRQLYPKIIEGSAEMKVNYEVTVKFNAVFDIEEIGRLKDNNEFATDICAEICDEIATAGGVAVYEVIESKIDVK